MPEDKEEPKSAPELPILSKVDEDKESAEIAKDLDKDEEVETDNSDDNSSSDDVLSDDSYKKPGKFKRVLAGYWRKKKWTLPLTVLVLILIILALPFTRYKVLGLELKRSFSITIVDSKTNTPVSGAIIKLNGKTATTNSAGKASLKAKVGQQNLQVDKKYYKEFSGKVFVGISTKHNSDQFKLDATGRQVPLEVVNKITGKPVAEAVVKVLGTEAKTDKDGKVTIVLPTSSPTQSASVQASSYNSLAVKIQVTSKVVKTNTFDITPAGHVYFLSNASGNIDVIKANLDGTDRQTVLAGTGKEDQNNTVLLASRDWKYLALLSKRDGGQDAKLFLIDTSTDKTTSMDEGLATFTPVGWSGHYFVYQVNRDNVPNWKPGATSIKSFNADNGQIKTLVNSSATGTSNANAKYENIWNVLFLGKSIVYTKTWYQYPGYTTVSGKQNVIAQINADGSGGKTIKSFDAAQSYVGELKSIKPDQMYFGVSSNTGANTTYYELDQNGSVTQRNTITFDDFDKAYPTYLASPSGSQAFWADLRDGKNTLFVGDYDGDNGNQIASLSDYTSYGWYTNNYLLVEKGGSELYVMPTSGDKAIKISDYYKPPRSFYGYGGGYGGL